MKQKKAMVDYAVIFGVIIFLGAIYTLNYETPEKGVIDIQDNGFTNKSLNISSGEVILINNFGNDKTKIVFNEGEPKEIKKNKSIKLKTISKGEINVSIINNNCEICSMNINIK